MYVLDARQLGLKLIANVTFGYTAASYSGRMPCVEVRLYLYLHLIHLLYRSVIVSSVKQERHSTEQYNLSTVPHVGVVELYMETLTGRY